jgi:hypothetical protein
MEIQVKLTENCINLRLVHITIFTTASRTALGPTQPPIRWVPGALYLGIKRPGREADHSPPSSAEVKNAWRYTCTPPIRLNGVVISYAQGQFYFNFYHTTIQKFLITELSQIRSRRLRLSLKKYPVTSHEFYEGVSKSFRTGRLERELQML